MLTVMLLTLNNWFWLRDPLSPWFLGYVGCLFLNMAGAAGFVGQFVLPEAPDLANHWVRLTALGAIACGNGFYRLLFGVDSGQRVLYGLYQAGIWVPLAVIPLTFVGYQTEVMWPVLAFVLVMNGVGLYLATRLWRRREAGGGFMLIANLISMLGLLVLMLLVLGYISGGLPSLYSLHIASLGTVLALYLAVGARYLEALRRCWRCATRAPGIPPALRTILFDRYVRGADVGDIPGTGLGLYLVRRIARWHEGEVECRDPDAGGACLLVTLPLYGPMPRAFGPPGPAIPGAVPVMGGLPPTPVGIC